MSWECKNCATINNGDVDVCRGCRLDWLVSRNNQIEESFQKVIGIAKSYTSQHYPTAPDPSDYAMQIYLALKTSELLPELAES